MRSWLHCRVVLFVALAVTVLLWLLLTRHESREGDWIDDALVILIAATFILAPAVQLKWTSEWLTRSVGVFLTSIGLAIIFTGALWVRLIADQPQPVCTLRMISANTVPTACTMPVRTPEWLTDLGRACLAVGGALFLVGLIRWARYKITEDDEAPPHQKVWPLVERRNGSPGRRATDGEGAG